MTPLRKKLTKLLTNTNTKVSKKNFHLPDLEKHRAFVSDLFNYMWKYHSRFKVGVWHHDNSNIGNKPITTTESSNKDKSNDTTQGAILNVIKNGIHEEEYEFMADEGTWAWHSQRHFEQLERNCVGSIPKHTVPRQVSGRGRRRTRHGR